MATYKVIQDIEAEDKLVGPLTLRQFIYAAITMLCLYICFIGLTKNVIFIIPIFFPVGAVSGFFAFPWGREQPTEIWALAKIRFMIKPRRRIWDQSGVKELVTITVPKRVEPNYTNGLSQTEVKSRLKALADTIDSRGWAIKNVNVNLYAQPLNAETSDRLIGATSLPQDVSSVDVRASDDILDPQNNAVAHQFEAMIEQSAQTRRQQAIQAMTQAQTSPTPVAPSLPAPTKPAPAQPAQATQQPNDYWFMQQGSATPTTAMKTQIVAPGSDDDIGNTKDTADEHALAERLRAQNDTQHISYSHLHTIQPLSVQQEIAKARAAELAKQKAAQAEAAAVTAQPDPAIIALASNNDFNVATIARQANKQQESDDEVVISLH